jgi:hypothetical protein
MILREKLSSGYRTGQPGMVGNSIHTVFATQSAGAQSGRRRTACAIQV